MKQTKTTEHPSLTRARALAASLGSTATTLRGIVRFLRDHRPAVGPIRGIGVDAMVRAWPYSRVLHASRMPRPDLTRDERDARRARDDRRFRRSFLARLRRREQAAISYPLTLSGVTQRAESGVARKTELAEVAALRSVVMGKPTKALDLPVISGAVKVPVDEATARKCGNSLDMRGKDATHRPSYRSHGNHSAGETEWKNGKPVNYTRATHDNWTRSFAIIAADGRSIAYACHSREITVTLPAGYLWDVDGNGLRAVDAAARHVDYHPEASDLLRKDAAAHIVTTLERNRAQRELMRAQQAAERAQLAGVFVCLADALRAGNCKAGCEAFAARHALDTRRHYQAPKLLEIANGEAGRVRLAITAARIRHEREMAQGFAVLAEHMV